jgi:hypothetical protein
MQSWVHVPTGTRGIAIGSYDETSFHVIPRIDRNRSKATPQYLYVVACTHNSNCTFSQVCEPATTGIQWSVHHLLHASEDTRCSAMRANNIRMLPRVYFDATFTLAHPGGKHNRPAHPHFLHNRQDSYGDSILPFRTVFLFILVFLFYFLHHFFESLKR